MKNSVVPQLPCPLLGVKRPEGKSMISPINLLQFEVLVVHQMEWPLLKPEPNDSLFRFESHDARLVEGGNNSGVLLCSLWPGDGFPRPENVGSLQFFLSLHACGNLLIPGDTCGRWGECDWFAKL